MARSRGAGLTREGPTGRHPEGLAAAPQRQLAPTGRAGRKPRWQRWNCVGIVTLLDGWAAVNTKHVPKTEEGPGKT